MSDGRAGALTTIALVRHGETEGESSVRYHGRTDVPLSELGRAQMRAARRELALRLGETRFAPVFSSPLIRAIEGARLIAGGGATLVTIDEFAEVHFGLFEGLTAEEIRERYPEEFARWRADPLAPAYTYPGGENRGAFVERVRRGLDRMLTMLANQPSDGGCALVVAHRGVIRAIVSALAGEEPSVELGSVHILERLGSRWHPRALDITAHLPR
jgi:probable phosphoglycerate mutase